MVTLTGFNRGNCCFLQNLTASWLVLLSERVEKLWIETVRIKVVVYWGWGPKPVPPLKELLTLPTVNFQLLKVVMNVPLNKTKTRKKKSKIRNQNQAIPTLKSILESQRETTHVHHHYIHHCLLICATLLKWITVCYILILTHKII